MNAIKLLRFIALLLAFSTAFARTLRAQEPASTTVCNLGTGEAPLVSLKWLEQPEPGGVRSLDGDFLTLVAHNHSREPQLARIAFSAHGNQSHPRPRPRRVTLAPGESKNIRVSLKGLGFEPRELRTSGSLRASVEVMVGRERVVRESRLLDAETLDQSLSPRIYFHGVTSRQSFGTRLLVYDAAARRDRFGAGDVRQAFSESLRRDLAAIRRPEIPAVLASVIDAGGGARRPDDVLDVPFGGPGSGEHTFCVRIPFDTQDSGVGEDFFAVPGTQWAPASFARVDVTNFNFGQSSVVVDDGRLDANGCISFDHDATSDAWSVIVLSQADVPRSDQPTETNRFNALDSGGNLSTWWWNGDIDESRRRPLFLPGRRPSLEPFRRRNLFAGAVQRRDRGPDPVRDGRRLPIGVR